MLDDATATARRVVSEFSEKNVTFMAGSIAYTAVISLAPLLLVLLLAVSAVGGGLEERIVSLASGSLPDPIAAVIADVFEGEPGAGASVIGLVVLVWGSLKVFRGLDTAFSEIYETTTKNSFVDKVVDALVVLTAVVIAVVATVALTAAFARLEGSVPYVGFVTPLVLLVGLILAFAPLYYRFPDTDVSWRHVLPGAVFAAVGWAAFQSVFQVYLAFSEGGSENFFGGIIVVVTWLYFVGLVLLLGAVINAVIGGYSSGSIGGVGRQEGISPVDGAPTAREQQLTPGQFANYLESVRREVTRRPAEVRPTDGGTVPPRRRPLPADGVEVRERAARDGDAWTWELTARWRINEDVDACPTDD